MVRIDNSLEEFFPLHKNGIKKARWKKKRDQKSFPLRWEKYLLFNSTFMRNLK